MWLAVSLVTLHAPLSLGEQMKVSSKGADENLLNLAVDPSATGLAVCGSNSENKLVKNMFSTKIGYQIAVKR